VDGPWHGVRLGRYWLGSWLVSQRGGCIQQNGGPWADRKNYLGGFQIRGQFEVFGLLTQLLALLMGRQMRGVPCIGKVALTLAAVALPLVAAKRADTGALGLRQVCRL
jgi:hypothetical protein